MIKSIAALTFLIIMFLGPLVVNAGDGYPWRDHSFPYDFRFGNHIDTHQQTKLMEDEDIFGFLYITFTGEVTTGGLPVARHCSHDTSPDKCFVGWILRGKPGKATFVFHRMDHPIWLVDNRSDIPQPGAFSHFHWLSGPEMAEDLVHGQPYEEYFIELRAINTFAFLHGGEHIPVFPGTDISTHVNIVGSFPLMDQCTFGVNGL